MVESSPTRRAIHFALALVLGLALLTWVAAGIVQRTTKAWFENDVGLRAELTLSGARQALVAHWNKELPGDLQQLLEEFTQEERIMAAAACAPDLSVLAQTRGFPAQISCREL